MRESESYYIWNELKGKRGAEIKGKIREAFGQLILREKERRIKKINYLVCLVDGKPAGVTKFISTKYDPLFHSIDREFEGYIFSRATEVLPEFRRKGIATRLTEKLGYYALSKNKLGIVTDVAESGMDRAYKRVIKESKKYHPNKGKVGSEEAVKLFIPHRFGGDAIRINPEALKLRKKEIKEAREFHRRRRK